MAQKCTNPTRKQELLVIANNCETCLKILQETSMRLGQFLVYTDVTQIESSGHSISAGRFDQYLYPYYKNSIDNGSLHANLHRKYLTVFGLSLTTF